MVRPAGRWPLPLRLYEGAADLLLPVAQVRAARRLRAGGFGPRAPERLGRASLPRPPGRLAWFHGASVGEGLSILPLATALAADGPVLVTTGTAGSARVLGPRLPPGALHHFAPLDAGQPVRRFLDAWRPDLAVFAESEIWPRTLRETAARGIPLALVGARLSPRSRDRWARLGHSARALLGLFDRIWTQDEDGRAALLSLGADPARTAVGGNLKAAALPPPDRAERAALSAALGGAPVWTALSTHPGEEEAVLDAHARLRARLPGARLVLAPRHPERGGEVAALAQARGLPLGQRSRGEGWAEAGLLADTLGEAGLWLRLSPVAFLGASLVPRGGHNPWEPAACGTALLMGPSRGTIAADWAALAAAGAAAEVRDAPSLAEAVAALLSDPARAAAMGAAGRALWQAQAGRAEAIARALHGMRG